MGLEGLIYIQWWTINCIPGKEGHEWPAWLLYEVQITALPACWLCSPMAVVTGGLCTSSRKEGEKTPREKEGHKPPSEAQFSAFWHPLMLLCQDGQRMAHAGLNATQTGLPSRPSTHSSCNGNILILTTEKWNPKCPTLKVFPKDTWRKSWRNCHLVTINRLGTRVTARNRNLDSGFIQTEEIPAEEDTPPSRN